MTVVGRSLVGFALHLVIRGSKADTVTAGPQASNSCRNRKYR